MWSKGGTTEHMVGRGENPEFFRKPERLTKWSKWPLVRNVRFCPKIKVLENQLVIEPGEVESRIPEMLPGQRDASFTW